MLKQVFYGILPNTIVLANIILTEFEKQIGKDLIIVTTWMIPLLLLWPCLATFKQHASNPDSDDSTCSCRSNFIVFGIEQETFSRLESKANVVSVFWHDQNLLWLNNHRAIASNGEDSSLYVSFCHLIVH